MSAITEPMTRAATPASSNTLTTVSITSWNVTVPLSHLGRWASRAPVRRAQPRSSAHRSAIGWSGHAHPGRAPKRRSSTRHVRDRPSFGLEAGAGSLTPATSPSRPRTPRPSGRPTPSASRASAAPRSGRRAERPPRRERRERRAAPPPRPRRTPPAAPPRRPPAGWRTSAPPPPPGVGRRRLGGLLSPPGGGGPPPPCRQSPRSRRPCRPVRVLVVVASWCSISLLHWNSGSGPDSHRLVRVVHGGLHDLARD